MAKSKIEWTSKTWNPTTGCSKISSGCKNCYAEVMTKRCKAMGQKKYENGFQIKEYPLHLMLPFSWKKAQLIFVNSMSDLFHDGITLNYIKAVFKVMNENPHHTFQVLTKRSERLAEIQHQLNWTPNIWMGVSVENNQVLNRIDHLRTTCAHVKFLSCEPLLGPLKGVSYENLDWVIVGGESGSKSRSINVNWVEEIQQDCLNMNIPFFFKQWGGRNKKKAGRLLNGKEYNEMPYQFNQN